MATEPRANESATNNVVAFPTSANNSAATPAPLKLISKNDRRRVGHDTMHVVGKQAVLRDDISSLSIEVMLAVFAFITIVVYVSLS